MSLIGERIGKIRIVEQLGQGGMGEVFIGFDEKLKRKVAVKAIRGEKRLNAKAKARFLREAQVLSQLEHPYICRIYELLEEKDDDFLVLEYIRGNTLKQARKLGLGFQKKLNIADQIAQVLAAAHAKGVVHRDLKPANIMLDQAGNVKVLDFGLAQAAAEESDVYFPPPSPSPNISSDDATVSAAKTEASTLPGTEQPELAKGSPLLDETREEPSGSSTDSDVSQVRVSSGSTTEHGTVVGTPTFMSPEQARGKKVTALSDMYSFGLVLQWLFTEKGPYPKNAKIQEIYDLARNGQTLPVEGLDSDLERLINRLKTHLPELRPNAVESIDRLKEIRDKPKKRAKRMIVALFSTVLFVGATLSSIGFYRAVKSESLAREETLKVQKTVNMLQELLASADPSREGRDVKVIDMLEKFEPRLAELDEQPEIKANLLYALGTTTVSLGFFEKGREFLASSVSLRTTVLGENHHLTLIAKHDLAGVLLEQGDFSQAESMFRQIVDARKLTLGERHPETLAAKSSLAGTLGQQGKFENAKALLEKVLDIQLEVVGEEDKNAMSSMNNLAGVLSEMGQYDQAEVLRRRILDISRRTRGSEHPETLKFADNLASLFNAMGKFAQAETMHREVLAVRERVLGLEHPNTLATMNNLAASLLDAAKIQEAEDLMARVVTIQKGTLGEEHPNTVAAMNNLGSVYLRQEKYEPAAEIFRKVVGICRRILPEDHPQTLIFINNLALVLGYQEKYGEAEDLHRTLLGTSSRVLGENHPNTLNIMGNLAWVLNKRDKIEEAVDMFRRSYQGRNEALGEEHPHTIISMANLALALRNQQKLEEAESLLRRAVDLCVKVFGVDHPDTIDYQDNLAGILIAKKKFKEADLLCRKVIEKKEEILGETHPKTLDAYEEYAKFMRDLGRTEEAEKWQARVNSIRDSTKESTTKQ